MHIFSRILLSKETGDDKGGDRGAEEREVGVDDGPVEGVVVGQDGVEAGPVNPEENGSDHCEYVGAVAGALQVLGLIHLSSATHHRHGQAEVSSESVDENSAT